LTIDLHAGQIQGFFDIPVDHLFAVNIFVDYFKKIKMKDFVVVSPDVGSIKMARAYAKRFRAHLAIVDKRRLSDQEAEVVHVMGEVKGKNAVIVDDLVATGGTLVEAAKILKEKGAKKIYAAITHPILSGPAINRIKNAPFEQLVVCNTVPLTKEKMIDKIKVLSVAGLLADAIKRIHHEESVSCLFEEIYL
jgi:ribose-phosphate pyrophosphokinase